MNGRTEILSVRVTPEEKADVERAASRAGRRVGEWLRELARTAAAQSEGAAALAAQRP